MSSKNLNGNGYTVGALNGRVLFALSDLCVFFRSHESHQSHRSHSDCGPRPAVSS
jgi:hypothetical protein